MDAENGKTRYLLTWLDADTLILPASLLPIRRRMEDVLERPKEQVEIDMWLESPGGDANTAYKLALMLRDAAATVRVVVPDYAKSAATLLALVGDEIYLTPGAELGPLDAQMPEEGSLTGSTSALNIARAADEVARDAVSLAVAGGADLLNVTGLSRAETLNAMLGFSATFSEPLVRQLDPKLVHHAKLMLRVTARYAERLLTLNGNSRATQIADKLVENFPTHGYVIAQEEALQLGLPVHPFDSYDLAHTARAVHRVAEDGTAQIRFGRMDEFLEASDVTDEKEKGGVDQDDQPEEPQTAFARKPGPDGAQAADATHPQ